jgi:hypothetical protein
MKRYLKAVLLVMLALDLCLVPAARASGPHGVDIGWAISNTGTILLTEAKCAALSQAGTGWLRVSMRLIPGHDDWDAQIFGLYDTAVNNARRAGLEVILLIDGESWRGHQSDWTANNYENTGGSGDNDYLEGYATYAVAPIVQHFRDRVKIYELWNEPNAWTRSPAPGVYEGGSFIYPSNFSWLLTHSWVAVHITNNIDDVILFSGGVFGHNIGGPYSYAKAGAQYLDDTYKVGINTVGSFSFVMDHYGSYPLDGFGQHIYIDQGRLTTSGDIRQYLDWVRQAYTQYEGISTAKKVFITEIGWTTASVSADTQATNLATAFETIEATPWVQTAIWFNWQDGPGLRYGVLNSNGDPKPAYYTYQFYESYEGRFPDGTTHDEILIFYDNLGQSVLGNPYDNGGSAWVHTWGSGYAQDCEGGSKGKLVIMSSRNGTYEINNIHGLWDFYQSHDGITAHGYPKSEEYVFESGTRQDFETGYLTWDPIHGVQEH